MSLICGTADRGTVEPVELAEPAEPAEPTKNDFFSLLNFLRKLVRVCCYQQRLDFLCVSFLIPEKLIPRMPKFGGSFA